MRIDALQQLYGLEELHRVRLVLEQAAEVPGRRV
jgi:hypothetical protein